MQNNLLFNRSSVLNNIPDRFPKIGIADYFLKTTILRLLRLDTKKQPGRFVDSQDFFFGIDGDYPFDHTGKDRFLFIFLIDNYIDSFMQLSRHLIHRIGQGAEFMGVGDR